MEWAGTWQAVRSALDLVNALQQRASGTYKNKMMKSENGQYFRK